MINDLSDYFLRNNNNSESKRKKLIKYLKYANENITA